MHVAVVLGTRPEAIKLAPVVHALTADPGFMVRVVSTGQHRDLLHATLAGLGLVPDVDLAIMEDQQTLNGIVARAVPRLDACLAATRTDVVLVQGDTTSAFCAALAAFHRGLTVAHVEAGLRSGDRRHPYPEEVNRRMISSLTALHFPPTRTAAAALRAEGVPADQVLVTGNTVIDALLLVLAGVDAEATARPARPQVLVTLHRREAWLAREAGSPSVLDGILAGLRDAAQDHPGVDFAYPVHPNPQVRAAAQRVLGAQPNVARVEPLAYAPFVRAMARATLVVTDSGGIQEEAPSLGVPVLVLRQNTERPEGVASGAIRVVGTAPEAVRTAIAAALAAPLPPPGRLPCPNPYGDGHASARIRDALRHLAGRGAAPQPFDG